MDFLYLIYYGLVMLTILFYHGLWLPIKYLMGGVLPALGVERREMSREGNEADHTGAEERLDTHGNRLDCCLKRTTFLWQHWLTVNLHSLYHDCRDLLDTFIPHPSPFTYQTYHQLPPTLNPFDIIDSELFEDPTSLHVLLFVC